MKQMWSDELLQGKIVELTETNNQRYSIKKHWPEFAFCIMKLEFLGKNINWI